MSCSDLWFSIMCLCRLAGCHRRTEEGRRSIRGTPQKWSVPEKQETGCKRFLAPAPRNRVAGYPAALHRRKVSSALDSSRRDSSWRKKRATSSRSLSEGGIIKIALSNCSSVSMATASKMSRTSCRCRAAASVSHGAQVTLAIWPASVCRSRRSARART